MTDRQEQAAPREPIDAPSAAARRERAPARESGPDGAAATDGGGPCPRFLSITDPPPV